jgi:hypothetical protein
MFGIKISLGSVQACCEAVSAVAAPTTEAIHEEGVFPARLPDFVRAA